jgi:hypothetical protein
MNSNNYSGYFISGNHSRRRFISNCAACAACMSIVPMSSLTITSCSQGKKLRIRIVHALHAVVQPKPDWPNVGFDFGPEMGRLNTMLIKQFPGFDFIPTMTADKAAAEKVVAEDKTQNIDGYIVFQLNVANQVSEPFAASGKPVLFADFLFGGSGRFLINNSNYMKAQNPTVGFVSSSRSSDLISAVKCFEVIQKGGTPADFVAAVTKSRIELTAKTGNLICKEDKVQTLSTDECLRKMKESKILAVPSDKPQPAQPMMGIEVENIGFGEVNNAWEKADKDQALAIVERWKKTAAQIVDIKDETLQSSAAFYLGMKSVLKNHNANAITINCLGGFYGNFIHAYPCLGFHELNNEGLVGGCECDVRSTAVMTAIGALTKGRPGMISDPVMDTAKRQIIYAHCVASNRVFGPDGPTNPFTIMTHSEDRQGASVRSIMPEGYMTTTLEIQNNRKEILFHQAKAVGNDPEDKACRTKLVAEPVGDMEKLFRYWGDWGWHRVTFYGDLKQPVYALADAMDWKVVEEA